MHRYSVDIFSYSGPSGIMSLRESRIPLNMVLGGMSIVALPISSHEQTKNRVYWPSLLFSNIVGSLYF